MKCSVACKYYDIYVSSDGIKVCCLIKGHQIKNIPKPVRENCNKFCKKGK